MFIAAGCNSKSSSSATTGKTTAALDYPKKTINVIVPYAAGGDADLLVRAIVQAMNIGQAITVSNVTGGSATVGTLEAYNAASDGYTLLFHLPETMIASYICGILKKPVHEDFEMICNVATDGGVICVSANSPFKTINELIDYIKKNPGKTNWGGVGSLGNNQFGYAAFSAATGGTANYVPYESTTDARTALLGNHLDVWSAYVSGAYSYVKSGDMRALAVAMKDRSAYLPDVPTLSEIGYNLTWGLHREFLAARVQIRLLLIF